MNLSDSTRSEVYRPPNQSSVRVSDNKSVWRPTSVTATAQVCTSTTTVVPMDDFWSVALPSWLTGVGTVGLAAFAFVDSRANRRESERLREQAEAERQRADRITAESLGREEQAREREQAAQVVAWTDDVDVNGDEYIADPGDRPVLAMQGTKLPAAWVLNDSALPITNVNVKWCHDRNPTTQVESRLISVIPPRGRRIFLRPSGLSSWPAMPIELEFVDAHGRVWRRRADGQLERL